MNPAKLFLFVALLVAAIFSNSNAQVMDLGQDFETNAVVQLEYAIDGTIWGITSSSLERMPTVAGVFAVRSTDRGLSWDTSSITQNWWRWGSDIAPLDANTAYAITLRMDTTELYHTTNGGKSWKLLGLDDVHVDRIVTINFFSPTHGIILGSVGRTIERKWVISRTKDGGKTWETSIPLLPEPPIEMLAERNDRCQEMFGGTMFIGMSHGRILYTQDSGASWKFIKTGHTGSVNTIMALPDGTTLAVHTMDNGSNHAVATHNLENWIVDRLPRGTPPLHGARSLRNGTFITIPNALTKTTAVIITGNLQKAIPVSTDPLYSVLHFSPTQILCGTELLMGKGLTLYQLPE
ncbi:MAG: hypothetical protein HQ472_03540 [Ignavibacteria bacterium]|nr:hypothetical protein [Ignavibacteria bacterium]